MRVASRRPKRATRPSDPGIKAGYRSGLEDLVAEQLVSLGIVPEYEDPSTVIRYTPPLKTRRYTPDFKLPNGILIETKGRFVTADRQKHLHIKAEHPDKDIRFVFSRSSARISKLSNTTYADWCRKHGFKFADRRIPEEWLNE
jgi:hypothetical protein